MNRAIVVLRPEPGNRATAAAIEARGRRAIRLPLFEIRAVSWQAPDPSRFDALLLTSANAVRHAGAQLGAFAPLPVHAVGEVTAQAARRAGLDVVAAGNSGVESLLAAGRFTRALHLAGRDRTLAPGGPIAEIHTVYASEALPIPPEALLQLEDGIALVQSARAGARLAELLAPEVRITIRIVAVSQAAARACGEAWERIHVSARPSAEAMIEAAIALAD
ncbi:uroporphyrinogen-III synthase [Sphingomonas sp. MMS12-HWE2-04]|uniref:uroporphyrinogen-III synthase n=1 Tax=Sphingomonas sp. MMS12-HWE2-04 TaxID=3234199 RepID=UPI00385144EB